MLDLSHAFTVIEIKGDNVKDFFNRHLPLDLRDQSFPINSIASSAIHHVSVKIWRMRSGIQVIYTSWFCIIYLGNSFRDCFSIWI